MTAASEHQNDAIATVMRDDYGRMLAILIRQFNDFDLAEESLADALARGAENWKTHGLPANPAGWLVTVARRIALDRLRREQNRDRKYRQILADPTLEPEHNDRDPAELVTAETETIPDERLRLIFTCCHPSINQNAQVALALRTLCGLRTREIARAFVVPEATMAQRITRAKRKISAARIPFVIPDADQLEERLDGVLQVIYLVFNEGHTATEGENLLRHQLCDEAIRLGRMVAELMPDDPEALGLLGLMLLIHARSGTRVDANGALVPLDEQDRTHWDREMIQEGVWLMRRVLRIGRMGPYGLQGAIAALHAEARSYDETDWGQIIRLYQLLGQIAPSPVIELNRAIAVAMDGDLSGGLALLDALESDETLSRYHLLDAARADLLRRRGDHAAAADAYRRAIERTRNVTEQRFLNRRLAEVDQSPA
jgi:RNA polymerase sigma-70 factor, ECF subfamily